ncbi:MAG: agmatine deiminase family protein [Rheinheimera sp.]|nr:agmatine deiminase family protein [Rheinheimera sp.]
MSGYRLPPEWAPQDAVLLTWPHAGTDWADDLDVVETVFFQLAGTILRFQALVILCHDAALRDRLKTLFANPTAQLHPLYLALIPNNDSWARDHGPITVLDNTGAPVWLNFCFTGWGDKYAAALDNQINDRLFGAPFIAVRTIERLDLVLEGGAIDTDGRGTLLVTKRCLLHPNRNPGLSQHELTARLSELFGLQQILWLDHGQLAGDDTDGHIDMLARFTPGGAIVYQGCDDKNDTHFAELQAMAQQLATFCDAQGQAYPLFALPWPAAIFDHPGRTDDAEGTRLPASYANFLIINGAVLVPQYADEADARALAVIGQAFAGYDIIGIPCLPLIRQRGSLHCVTMQLPRGVLQTFAQGITH